MKITKLFILFILYALGCRSINKDSISFESSKDFWLGYVYHNNVICRVYSINFTISNKSKSVKYLYSNINFSENFIQSNQYFFIERQDSRQFKQYPIKPNSDLSFTKFLVVSPLIKNNKDLIIDFNFIWLSIQDFHSHNFEYEITLMQNEYIKMFIGSEIKPTPKEVEKKGKEIYKFLVLLKYKKKYNLDIMKCKLNL